MARSFNGTSDLIEATTFTSISYATVTLSHWINIGASTQNNARTLNNSHTDADNNGFQIIVTTTPTILFYVGNGSTNSMVTANASFSTWTHVVGLYNGANVIIYTNGVQQAALALTGSMGTSSFDLMLGRYIPSVGGPFFQGSMADVAIWNTALSALEISALASGARPHFIRPKSLQLFMPLDGVQSPEPDISGNQYNGTLTGTTRSFGPPLALFTPRWPQFTPSTASTFNAAWARNRNFINEGIAT